MNRWIAPAWVLFSITAYLMLVDPLRPWVSLPGPDDIGFTLVFVLFALVHSSAVDGPKRTGLFFAIAALISYAMEEIGIRTGWVFGHYHYGDMLGPTLGHVPVIIPLAWFMTIYPSWAVARALLQGIDTASFSGLTAQAATAAMVMTAWDVVMDPGMAAGGNWVWERGGAYFGVPLRNYVGCLLTTFLVYWDRGLAAAASGTQPAGFAALRRPAGRDLLPVRFLLSDLEPQTRSSGHRSLFNGTAGAPGAHEGLDDQGACEPLRRLRSSTGSRVSLTQRTLPRGF